MRVSGTARWLVLVVAFHAACATQRWHSVELSDLAGDRRELFVVTPGHAYVLRDAKVGGGAVRGTVTRAWRVPPAAAFSVNVGDPPDEIATRHGWTRTIHTIDRIAIPQPRVYYARTSEDVSGSTVASEAIAGALVTIGVLTLRLLPVLF